MAPDAKKIAAPKWQDLDFLIVSQDDQLRFWARSVFRKAGAADVFSTPTGSEALHILKTATADVILLDLFKEPRLAVRFVEHLRSLEHFATIPLILLIQSGDEKWVRAACQSGIQNVIRKPVAEAELLKRVAATITDPRPLVWTDNYVGKERRTPDPNFKGPDRRAEKPPPGSAGRDGETQGGKTAATEKSAAAGETCAPTRPGRDRGRSLHRSGRRGPPGPPNLRPRRSRRTMTRRLHVRRAPTRNGPRRWGPIPRTQRRPRRRKPSSRISSAATRCGWKPAAKRASEPSCRARTCPAPILRT